MPQLDTIYILMTYLWTWLILHQISKKIKTSTMAAPVMFTTTKKPTPTLQWL